MAKSLDAFQLHSQIMADYRLFVDSFVNIKNKAISRKVEEEMSGGKFWPEPLLQFNPAFESGDSVQGLCSEGVLNPSIQDIFSGFSLFKHQVEAIRIGSQGKDFVVTSGTGSGKSLTFLGTIFNHLLNNGTGTGIKAVIVYPMNALINSQTKEIEKYKATYQERTGKNFPIDFGQYTGQEGEKERKRIRETPPDIVLTNYMMLELILTRSKEHPIVSSIYENLQFLVFDELHTYRGRQGADVAMLIRRIKAKAAHPITCIGTSATMVSGGTVQEQKAQVATIATTFFGSPFDTSQIINEYLTPCFKGAGSKPSQQELRKSLQTAIDPGAGEESLKQHPLSVWLEQKVALESADSILLRRTPMRFTEVVDLLANDSGLERTLCKQQLQIFLKWLANVNVDLDDAGTRRSYLPYKIHQFIAQTGSVYVSLHTDENRIITLDPTHHLRSGDEKIIFYPLVFSRLSGHEFLCVSLDQDKLTLRPREFSDSFDTDSDERTGYIIPGDDVWNLDTDLEQLPEAWLQRTKSGECRPIKKYRDRFPIRIYFDIQGNYSFEPIYPCSGWFMAEKLLFDPTSGAQYHSQTSERTKLTRLGSEARSTSTTVISHSILTRLADAGIPWQDQKLLSFTDNRQDAALQAGHFNDTLRVLHLRSAIYHALEKYNTLDFARLDQAIFEALNLPLSDYAIQAESAFPSVLKEIEATLKDYLMYRAIYDLRRGWRVVLPNLEQCALLEIDYKNLQENCEADTAWQAVPFIGELSGPGRTEVVYQTLEYFRKLYAIYSKEYLDQNAIDEKRKKIREKLKEPWTFEENEKINSPYKIGYEPLSRRSRASAYFKSAGPNSALGKYLKSEAKKKDISLKKKADYQDFIASYFTLLVEAGWLQSSIAKNKENEDTPLYQLRIDTIIWKLGDGEHITPDRITVRSYKEIEHRPNKFYQEMYRSNFADRKKLIGREHTGQLSNEERIDREILFRSGEYSALFCSPTMELGIDIANLNVVHMRNVPPNSANYAQRGGRAGRSGQAALVFTNCSAFSPHDRHYFNHAAEMVAGVVTPPRIDLYNAELLTSHLNAVCLSHVKLTELNQSLMELVNQDDPVLPLREDVKEKLTLNNATKNEIKYAFNQAIHDLRKTSTVIPLSSEQIDQVIDSLAGSLDNALERWRRLYLAMQKQIADANRILESGIYKGNSDEVKDARRNVAQALRQRDLLKNEITRGSLSEFYPYRYLASEGFLPGYNFTRLPIRTFIPFGDAGEYVSRPRFIALREFGPKNVIYHNGSKYQVVQILAPEADLKLKKAKISTNAGYIMMDDEYNASVCPFSKTPLTEAGSTEVFVDLMEMTETKTREMERISCEEEERLSKGFEIKTYFSMPSGGADTIRKAIVKNEEDEFLNIRFLPTARLVQINKKWRATEATGFLMGLKSGWWKNEPKETPPADAEETRKVQLFTHDTADALYIEPIKSLALDYEGIVTLQYALKRAIENIFQIESREIGVELMGDEEEPNIFLYEAAEGSLGVLSRFVEEKDTFRNVIKEAITVCRYDDPEYTEDASYDDLLSYYNQRHHDIINRHLIRDALEKLVLCNLEVITNAAYPDYESQYQSLLKQIDPTSSTELKFLTFLHENGLKLPDAAQKQVDGIYCQPDFFYEPDVWVFCDGTPHDKPEIKAKDKKQRKAILNHGDQVFVYYYQDNLAEITGRRPDIFYKVK
jgi:superfamily II DNA/RNA helicase